MRQRNSQRQIDIKQARENQKNHRQLDPNVGGKNIENDDYVDSVQES